MNRVTFKSSGYLPGNSSLFGRGFSNILFTTRFEVLPMERRWIWGLFQTERVFYDVFNSGLW